MRNYRLSANRSGYQGRGAPLTPAWRSAQNEQDLSLAMRAERKLYTRLTAARIHGGDTRGPTNLWEIAKSIAAYLRSRPLGRASDKQLALLCKVLDEPVPARIDPVPAACRVLPLRPPGRS